MTQLSKPPINRRLNFYGQARSICEHGPITIPQDVFEYYIAHDAPNYNDPKIIFGTWINERNSDPLRLLALRDVLQQTHDYTQHTGIHACYLHNSDFDDILIKGTGNIDTLRELLRTRPKLTNELISELLFNAKEKITFYHEIPERQRASYDHIILILLSITTEETGRELMSYLSFNFENWDAGKMFATTTEAAQMPQWFRDEMLSRIAAKLQEDFKKLYASTSVNHSSDLIRNSPTLWQLSQYLQFATSPRQTHFPYQRPSITDIATLLHLIEPSIPSRGHYLHLDTVINLTPTLIDEEIAYQVAKRHLMAYSPDHLNPHESAAVNNYLLTLEGRNFLYWLSGLANYHDPANYDIAKTIRDLLDYLHHKTQHPQAPD